MTVEEIKKRIAEVERRKIEIVNAANQQLGQCDGQLVVLREWLAAIEKPDAASK